MLYVLYDVAFSMAMLSHLVSHTVYRQSLFFLSGEQQYHVDTAQDGVGRLVEPCEKTKLLLVAGQRLLGKTFRGFSWLLSFISNRPSRSERNA